ncbi:molybdopterin-dependent oxidoreductase [Dyadobacter subterraneus]|uniref:Molybdopterin-dependent oxidoreductase n=1 Tax=Dyadobacter subterraneus TaxID=2773304 RepID=A0ABR9WD82_9BACT|nr:molybdopterin-dependent oxidoreductase [Dyadobacter subterraneus]MBE9463433.1 molybdopterin-dependent oxidoreductase [Dyadobacter subterraneus]
MTRTKFTKAISRLLSISFLLISVTVFSQNANTVSISGEVTTALNLTTQDLAAYKQISHKVKDRDGKEHEFKGVALIEVFEKAGITTGGKLRGENLAKYVLIKAADGYEVIYSLPEIDPEFTDQVIMLATEKDGQPLPNGEGPFRIITPNDKKQARWIREVRSIKIVFAKD